MLKRRTAVLVLPSETVGHDLVFRHYTNKVVVGKHPDVKATRTDQLKGKRLKKNTSQ